MHGFLALDKSHGVSSNYAINGVKRLLPRGTKIGHAGTLDPYATGILVLLIGKYTKQCEAVMHSPKEYMATLTLGATTDSDDAETPPIVTPDATAPDENTVRSTCTRFVGNILQTPPIYSAIKQQGKRACDWVREGKTVVMQPRPVRIDSIDVVEFAYPSLVLNVACGRGTYIRSLARDIGQSLGTGAYLSQLRRTRVGPFDTTNCHTIEQLQTQCRSTGSIESALLHVNL
jgi:tRNA pseudouridine55 synthase